MTRKKPKAANNNEYTFRGRKFLIPAEELIGALAEARELHRQLIDKLLEEVQAVLSAGSGKIRRSGRGQSTMRGGRNE